VPNTLHSEPDGPQDGAVFYGNYIHDNNETNIPGAGITAIAPVGMGIDVAGGWDNIIRGNLIVNQKHAGVMVHYLPDKHSIADVARFDVDKSVLAVEPIVAHLQGAALDASLKIDAAAVSPQLALKGSVNDVDLRAALADATRTPWLEGKGALSWDLSASGASVGSLRHALAGTVNATVKGGALVGVDLRAALLDGKGELGKKGSSATAREYNAQASTPFSDLKLAAQIKEGRAHGQGLEMQAGPVRTAGEGELVLDTGALDLRLQAVVAGKSSGELAPLAGVTVPLHVSGPWRAPRFAFDHGAATGDKVPRQNDAALAPQAAAKVD